MLGRLWSYLCEWTILAYRLTEDDKMIDIPLSSQHGIKYPVAMCFNRNYTKLYIVNEWGKSVMVFNVI